MDKLEHTRRQSCFRQQFRQPYSRQRNLLAGLEDECVSARDGERKHPQRNHRGKIERSDSRADTERLPDGIAINPPGDIFQGIAHEERRNRGRVFHHLDAAPDITPGLG